MRFVILIRLLLLLCIAFTLSVISEPIAGGEAQTHDWPRWRGPDCNGVSQETSWRHIWPKEGLKTLWKTSVGAGFSGISIKEGRLYTMGFADEKDTIWCLDAETGKEVWRYSYPSIIFSDQFQGPASTPTVDDNYVYTISRKGIIHCVERLTGKPVWSCDVREKFGVKPLGHGFCCSALIEGDRVIMDIAKTVAFDKKNGDVVWETEDYGPSYCSPVAFDQNGVACLAVFNGTGLVVLRLKDGSEVCRQPWNDTGANCVNAQMPIVEGDRIFFCSSYDDGSGLIEVREGKQAKLVYKNVMRTGHHFAGYVLWDGHLYGIDETQIHCLDFATGKEVWAEDAGIAKGSLMLADEKLIILSEKGELVIAEASPQGYQEHSRAQVLGGTSWTPPVLANKRIYCRNGEGDLVCVDASVPSEE